MSVKHAKKAAKKATPKTKEGEEPAGPEQKFDRPSLRDLKRVHADQRLPEEDRAPFVAEVHEQVHDIVAEVDAETGKTGTVPHAPARPAA